MKYRVKHNAGEFVVNFQTDSEKYVARICDANLITNVNISATSVDELFRNCRSWASGNIRGEFIFEKVSEAA